MDVDNIVVIAEHAPCGGVLLAFPSVVRSEGLVVILAGGIGVTMPGLVPEQGTPGLLFECGEPACDGLGWVFSPHDLETLTYIGDQAIAEFDDEARHVFVPDAPIN